jgi:drug/metabolite transporter (DMT)-like permease
MAPADLARMFALAALWGSAFLFLKLAAPGLGAILTAELRVLIAGVVLGAYALAIGERIAFAQHARVFVVIGAITSAIPFTLYAFSAIHIPAGMNAILNGMSPMFGAIAAALLLRDPLTVRRVGALLLGFCGILVLVGDPAIAAGPMTNWAILAGLLGALSYGFASVGTKLMAPAIAPLTMAVGTQLTAAAMLAPFLLIAPAPGPITLGALLAATALGVLCSGIGYILYFQLIRNVGPVKLLLVTFLIPVFGVLWGVVFLGEHVGLRTLIGGGIVLAAIGLESRRPK